MTTAWMGLLRGMPAISCCGSEESREWARMLVQVAATRFPPPLPFCLPLALSLPRHPPILGGSWVCTVWGQGQIYFLLVSIPFLPIISSWVWSTGLSRLRSICHLGGWACIQRPTFWRLHHTILSHMGQSTWDSTFCCELWSTFLSSSGTPGI